MTARRVAPANGATVFNLEPILIDHFLQKKLQRYLLSLAKVLHHHQISANKLTAFGLVWGLVGSALIGLGFYGWGLLVFSLSRLCDGLDGALARLTQPTRFGAFWDIVADFIVYASIPLGFAYAHPEQNALASAVLMFSFMGTASSFLALAVVHPPSPDPHNLPKGMYYVNKGVEATETWLFFALMAFYPAYYPILAYTFAVLCLITTGLRVFFAYKLLADSPSNPQIR